MNDLKISLAAARVNAGLTQEKVANALKISKKSLLIGKKELLGYCYLQKINILLLLIDKMLPYLEIL